MTTPNELEKMPQTQFGELESSREMALRLLIREKPTTFANERESVIITFSPGYSNVCRKSATTTTTRQALGRLEFDFPRQSKVMRERNFIRRGRLEIK